MDVEAPPMGYGIYPIVGLLLLGVVALDLVAMRRLAHQRVEITGEGWGEFVRIASADPSRLNATQRQLVSLGWQRRQATDVDTARRLELAMDRLVREHHRHLS